jgi:hypothetical protein
MMLTKTRIVKFLFVCISTFGVMNVSAQRSAIDSLRSRFDAFRSKNFTEKIFLHTDRSSYFTGEAMWFNMYHVDASFHKPLAWSKVLYVELIGRDGNAVLQGKFPLGDTTTTGSLFLPASVSSGNYELIAYTSWMKNFDPEYFFKQPISIINPFMELTKDVPQGPEYDVQFFPEGGGLVNGLESVVGVRAVGRDGQGINFRGTILNQQNDTVARFRPFKFGLGKFSFTPEPNQVYKAIITDHKKRNFTVELPRIAESGYVMQVSELMTKIKITVSKHTENPDPVYLLTHTRQKHVTAEQQTIKNGEAVFIIDKKQLGDGVSHFTLFDANLAPVCERLWFKKPQHTLSIYTEVSDSVFSTRQKAAIEIRCRTDDNPAAISNLSVVVCKIDSLDLPTDNLVSYLMLTSDLSGNVEHGEYYFGAESVELSEATNNLMLTHGWRRFNWNDMVAGKNDLRYLPELNGHIISGRMADKVTKQSIDRSATYLTFTGLPVNLYISRSDSLGKILFETHPGRGKKNLIVQTESISNDYKLELDDPFYVEHPSRHIPTFLLDRNLKTSVEQRSIHMQVNALFHPARFINTTTKNESSFYGKADKVYRLDDYTRFPTMEEVLREYVPGVRVSKMQGHFQLHNLDMVNKQPFRKVPLVLVDGVPVFDMDKVMAIDPLKIEKLDVLTKRYYLQVASFEGIVSLTSYKNDLGGFQPPANALLTTYSGFEEYREFFTPVYQTEKQISNHTPDVRYVLYRSPDKLAASGNAINLTFFTSDITGEYSVVVQGITTDGLPGFFSTTFKVR